MKKSTAIAVFTSLTFSGAALAQTMATESKTTSTKPAVTSPSDTAKSADAPVPGKNSFTESEARHRIEKHGYSSVSALTKDENSVWHARATKGAQPVNVTVDYQGNITEQ